VAQKVARSLAFSMGNAVFFHVLWVFFLAPEKKNTQEVVVLVRDDDELLVEGISEYDCL